MNNFGKSSNNSPATKKYSNINVGVVTKVNSDSTVDLIIPDLSETLTKIQVIPISSSQSNRSIIMPEVGSQCMVLAVGVNSRRFVIGGINPSTGRVPAVGAGEASFSSKSKSEIRQDALGNISLTSPDLQQLILSSDGLTGVFDNINVRSNGFTFIDGTLEYQKSSGAVATSEADIVAEANELIAEFTLGFMDKVKSLSTLGIRDEKVPSLVPEIKSEMEKYRPGAEIKTATISSFSENLSFFGAPVAVSVKSGVGNIIIDEDGNIDINGSKIAIGGKIYE